MRSSERSDLTSGFRDRAGGPSGAAWHARRELADGERRGIGGRVMAGGEWVRGPFGLDAERGRTVPCQRSVLVVVHHLTAATRLADVVPLLEADRRVQTVFTVPPSSLFSAGADAFLAGLGGVTVPW